MATCMCHEYDLNELKRKTPSVIVETQRCEDLVGFSPLTWGVKIIPKAKEIKAWWRERYNE